MNGSPNPGKRVTGSAIPHYPVLDELRGGAVIAVIVFHCFLSTTTTSGRALDMIYGGIVAFFPYAIDLFFVISGFLITLILDRTRSAETPIRTFYIRRALRIVPLYYGFLLFALIFLGYLGPRAVGAPGSTIWEWLFLTNFTLALEGPEALGALYPHFWSLAVEEQFYLVWPWVVILISPRRLMPACLAIAVVSFTGRVILSANGLTYASWFLTPTRLDGLALGSFVALLHRAAPELLRMWSRRAFIFSMIIAVAVLVIVLPIAQSVGGEPLRKAAGTVSTPFFGSILFAALIAHVAAGNTQTPSTGAARTLLRSVARYSYGMYALHVPIIVILFDTGKIPQSYPIAGYDLPYRLGYTLMILVLSYVTGLATWHLYEKRMLRLAPSYRYTPSASTENERQPVVQPLPVP